MSTPLVRALRGRRRPHRAGLAALALALVACEPARRQPDAPPEPARVEPRPQPGADHTADAARMPTMDRTLFLAGFEGEPQKTRLWELFRLAEADAKTFAASPDRWVPIRRVDVGTAGAKWKPTGVIELWPDADPGTLFHEIFHTVFHESALHAGHDERWGEAFCDAFRYVTERTRLPGPASPWVTKLDRYLSMTFDQVMAQSGDPSHDKKYAYPASLILAKTDRTTAEVRKLWFDLAKLREERGADVLDGFFGYDVATGQPRAPVP